MVGIVAAVLARRLVGAPRWPIAASVGLLALMSLQAFAGFRSLVALHVPLGVLVILLSVALAIWAWRWQSSGEQRARVADSERTAEPVDVSVAR